MRTYYGAARGTGAALDIRVVGFRPSKVEVFNAAAGGLTSLMWQKPMPDASARKTAAAGTQTFITTLGITPLADGFTLGADTDMNVAGEIVYYQAHGPAPSLD